MDIHLGWPQATVVVLMTVEMIAVVRLHGWHTVHSAWTTGASMCTLAWLLWMGGFFG